MKSEVTNITQRLQEIENKEQDSNRKVTEYEKELAECRYVVIFMQYLLKLITIYPLCCDLHKLCTCLIGSTQVDSKFKLYWRILTIALLFFQIVNFSAWSPYEELTRIDEGSWKQEENAWGKRWRSSWRVRQTQSSRTGTIFLLLPFYLYTSVCMGVNNCALVNYYWKFHWIL